MYDTKLSRLMASRAIDDQEKARLAEVMLRMTRNLPDAVDRHCQVMTKLIEKDTTLEEAKEILSAPGVWGAVQGYVLIGLRELAAAVVQLEIDEERAEHDETEMP